MHICKMNPIQTALCTFVLFNLCIMRFLFFFHEIFPIDEIDNGNKFLVQFTSVCIQMSHFYEQILSRIQTWSTLRWIHNSVPPAGKTKKSKFSTKGPHRLIYPMAVITHFPSWSAHCRQAKRTHRTSHVYILITTVRVHCAYSTYQGARFECVNTVWYAVKYPGLHKII